MDPAGTDGCAYLRVSTGFGPHAVAVLELGVWGAGLRLCGFGVSNSGTSELPIPFTFGDPAGSRKQLWVC